MATSLLALLDDITTVLDDVSILAKVAAKKTSGVLGDDLALNAQQVAGVDPDRELPVVWAVAKGSMWNKAILVPSALILSAAAPWAVTPLLMIGGLYLCYEGAEKLAHRMLHTDAEDEKAHEALVKAVAKGPEELLAFEAGKIKGAIRTDFVLSAEIIAITLGTVAGTPLLTRAGVLAAIALLMTVFVYGFVAAIVKLDDFGANLSRRRGGAAMGGFILASAPWLMKGLSVAGTAAMFLVGGGILAHALHVHGVVYEALTGLVAGALAVGAVEAVRKLRR